MIRRGSAQVVVETASPLGDCTGAAGAVRPPPQPDAVHRSSHARCARNRPGLRWPTKAFFLAPAFFPQRPDDFASGLWPGLKDTDNHDFLMWALVGQRGEFTFTDEQLFGASETELYAFAGSSGVLSPDVEGR